MIRYHGSREVIEIEGLSVFIWDSRTQKDTDLTHILKHSPDGFEWGYAGSGPADLALSILHDYCSRTDRPFAVADTLYQQFKQDFIVPVSGDLSITGEQIESWLNTKGY